MFSFGNNEMQPNPSPEVRSGGYRYRVPVTACCYYVLTPYSLNARESGHARHIAIVHRRSRAHHVRAASANEAGTPGAWEPDAGGYTVY